MAYRNFRRPTFSFGDHSTDDWFQWFDAEGLLHPVAPMPEACCSRCYGAVGARYDDSLFDMCPQCAPLEHDDPLDGFVPIVYATDATFESMLHRFKDWNEHGLEDHTWLQAPLGCLLEDFWSRHAICMRAAFGAFDLVVQVPSNNQERRYSQLSLINEFRGHRQPTLEFVDGIIERNFNHPRPRRREIRPESYVVPDRAQVRRRTILLVDDTWTTGATLRSSAAALKAAGAGSVIGLTLSRQLTIGFGSTREILGEIADRTWSTDCVLCA